MNDPTPNDFTTTPPPPPQSAPPPSDAPVGQELADRGARLVAVLIDGLIQMAIMVPVLMVTGVFKSIASGNPPGFLFNLMMGVVGMVVYFLINGKFLATQGQSIGKKVMKVRIVSAETGQIITLQDLAAKRYAPVFLATQVPFIGGLFGLADCLLIFRDDRRCIHDLIANTKVVKA